MYTAFQPLFRLNPDLYSASPRSPTSATMLASAPQMESAGSLS